MYREIKLFLFFFRVRGVQPTDPLLKPVFMFLKKKVEKLRKVESRVEHKTGILLPAKPCPGSVGQRKVRAKFVLAECV